jgi:hypothetical protein
MILRGRNSTSSLFTRNKLLFTNNNNKRVVIQQQYATSAESKRTSFKQTSVTATSQQSSSTAPFQFLNEKLSKIDNTTMQLARFLLGHLGGNVPHRQRSKYHKNEYPIEQQNNKKVKASEPPSDVILKLTTQERHELLGYNPKFNQIIEDNYRMFVRNLANRKNNGWRIKLAREFISHMKWGVSNIMIGKDVASKWSSVTNHPGAQYDYKFYAAKSSTDKNESLRWVAHKFVMDEYRAFMSFFAVNVSMEAYYLSLYVMREIPMASLQEFDFNFLIKYMANLSYDSRYPGLPATIFKLPMALFLVDQMLLHRVTPSSWTFNALLGLNDVEPSDFGERIVQILERLQIPFDIVTYSRLVEYSAKYALPGYIRTIYDHMRVTVPPEDIDQQSYVITMCAASHLGDHDFAHKVFVDLHKQFSHNLNNFALNAMIHSCIEGGQYQTAEALLMGMIESKNVHISTINNFLTLLQRRSDPAIEELFDTAEEKFNVVFDHYSYGSLLSYLLDTEDYPEVDRRYAELVKRGITRTEVISNLMARNYAEQGDVDRLHSLLEDMKQKRERISPNFLQVYLRAMRNIGHGFDALEMYLFDTSDHFAAVDIQFANFLISFITSIKADPTVNGEMMNGLWRKFNPTIWHDSHVLFELLKRFTHWFANYGRFDNLHDVMLEITRRSPASDVVFGPYSLFSMLHNTLAGLPTLAGFVGEPLPVLEDERPFAANLYEFKSNWIYYTMQVCQRFGVQLSEPLETFWRAPTAAPTEENLEGSMQQDHVTAEPQINTK